MSSRAMRHAICRPQDPSGRHVAELRKEEARMEQLTGMWPEITWSARLVTSPRAKR